MTNKVKIILSVTAILVGFFITIMTRHSLVLEIKDWLHSLACMLFGFGIGMLWSLWTKKK